MPQERERPSLQSHLQLSRCHEAAPPRGCCFITSGLDFARKRNFHARQGSCGSAFFTLAEFSNSSPKKIGKKKGIKHEEPLGNDAGGFGVLNKTGFLQKKHHKNPHKQPRTVFKSVHGVFSCRTLQFWAQMMFFNK